MRRDVFTRPMLKPPYPLVQRGICAGCGAGPSVRIVRVFGPEVFRYRCTDCLTNEPEDPPKED